MEANNKFENNMVTFDEILNSENKEMQQRREKKRLAIMQRISGCAEKFSVSLPTEVIEKVADLTIQPEIDGSVGVTTHRVKNPEVVDCGNVILEYKLEKSTTDWGHPYVLFLYFVTKEDVAKLRMRSFVNWAGARNVPYGEEIASKVNLGEDVNLHIFKKAADFVREVKPHLNKGEFVGQQVSEKLAFVPSRPIGFIAGNEVYISVPTWKAERNDKTFCAR